MKPDVIANKRAILQSRCQNPAPGPFDITHIEWALPSEKTIESVNTQFDPVIPFTRVQDFLNGEKARGICGLSIEKTLIHETLDEPKLLSYKESIEYYCEFCPEDLRLGTPEYNARVAAAKGKGKELS